MAKDARQPIAGWRNEVLSLAIRVVGLDLSGKVLRGQVRLAPGTPGASLVDLATVTNGNAEGIRLGSVSIENGVPTSSLTLRVNKTTMQGLPATGELGAPTVLAYAMQLDGVTRLWGDFIVLDSAIDSDGNVANRLPGYGTTRLGGTLDGVSLTIGNDGVTVAIDGAGELARLLSFATAAVTAARDQAAAAALEARTAVAARIDAEVARDRSNASAAASGASAALAGVAQAAIEKAISKVPTDSRLLLEAATVAVLRGVAGDTPIGRLAYLSEPGREGVWQLRAGDYATRIASDAFGFRYLAMNAKGAAQQAWERIVPDGVFQATWTGMTAATVDTLAMLKAAAGLVDPYSTIQLPPYRMPVGSSDPRIALLVPGTQLRGHGDASWIDYTGGATIFWLLQAAADDVRISDLRASLIAPNDSAGNPSCIMVGSHRAGDTPRPVRGVRIGNVLLDRTSTGVIAFVHAIEGSPEKGFVRPSGIEIEDARITTNGVAVSLFGAADVAVTGGEFTYSAALPSNSPAAKKLGVRILGTERALVSRVRLNGFPTGVMLDAAYVSGQRLYNRDVTVMDPRFVDIVNPVSILECRGDARFVRPVWRRALTATDRATFCDIGTNLEVNSAPGMPTELGNVTIEAPDCEGASVFLSQNGRMGHLTVRGGQVVGNQNGSPMDGQTGAVRSGGVAGWPESTRLLGTDFLMAVPASAASPIIVGVAQAGDVVEIEGCKLPEYDGATPISAAGVPAFYSGGAEQRPFAGRVNLGANRVHRPGSLAQRRDGTPIPAPATPAAAPWTRNLLRVTETSAGVFVKNAGGGGYDAAVWSTEKLTSDFELVYRLGQISQFLLVGLSNTPGAPGAGSTDWSTEYQAGPASTIGNFAQQLAQAGSYEAGTIERWRRQASRLIFSRGGVDMFDTAVSPERGFALQVSFARVNDSVEILRFGAI